MKRNFEDLEKLDALLKKGIITEAEFRKEKDRILNGSVGTDTTNLFGLTENAYGFLIHISVLLGFIHVVLGFLAPVVLWALNRDKSQMVDQHGRNVLNWIFSLVLYLMLSFFIAFILGRYMHVSMDFSFNILSPLSMFRGFSPIPVLMILNILFVIIGAIKASSGKLWRYPLSIKFL